MENILGFILIVLGILTIGASLYYEFDSTFHNRFLACLGGIELGAGLSLVTTKF